MAFPAERMPHSVIAFGDTPNDARKAARNLASNALPGWRQASGPTVADASRPTVTIEPPGEAVVLAARHLDPTEGRAQHGPLIDSDTRGAINTVLRYVAMAHNAPRSG